LTRPASLGQHPPACRPGQRPPPAAYETQIDGAAQCASPPRAPCLRHQPGSPRDDRRCRSGACSNTGGDDGNHIGAKRVCRKNGSAAAENATAPSWSRTRIPTVSRADGSRAPTDHDRRRSRRRCADQRFARRGRGEGRRARTDSWLGKQDLIEHARHCRGSPPCLNVCSNTRAFGRYKRHQTLSVLCQMLCIFCARPVDNARHCLIEP
jgi:hypothetical protein